MNSLRRVLASVCLCLTLSACAGVTPPVSEPVPPAPIPVPASPAVAEDVWLELLGVRVLLESGRPRAAARAMDDLVVRLPDSLTATPEGRGFSTEAFALWSAAHVLSLHAPDHPVAPAAPPPDPWWDEADLARDEVSRWRTYFLGEGAVGLRQWLEQAAPYRAEILGVLRAEGVPEELWVITLIESGLNMRARNRSGAVGPWQLVPNTARHLGVLITPHRDQRQDWHVSTGAACRYLKELKEELGDGLLALAAFNCGPGRVRREIRRAGTRTFWELGVPPETRAYVPRALALASILGTGEGTEAAVGEGLVYESVPLPHPVRLTDLARVSGGATDTLRDLNPALLLDVTPADGHPVRVRVPSGSAQRVLAGLRDGALPETQPPPAKRYHRVRSGDTLWDLARKYGTSVRELRRVNGLRRGAVLRLGKRLEIPG